MGTAERPCPVCREMAKGGGDVFAAGAWVDCERCGSFELVGIRAPRVLETEWTPLLGAVLSHEIRRRNQPHSRVSVDLDFVERHVKDPVLPGPAEQLERLLLWVADESPAFGHLVPVDVPALSAIVGALDDQNLGALLAHLGEEFGTFSGVTGRECYSLTMRGWERIEELRRARGDSRKVFMAMAYSNTELARIVDSHFRGAVKQAGFSLVRLDDEPEPGSIDNRLRVEIRTSRLLVADLTDKNEGAYWEAGFAEGLGIPVVYTCERSQFEKVGTHFDTRQLHTIPWDPDAPQEAARALADTIRNAFPSEATMEDLVPE